MKNPFRRLFGGATAAAAAPPAPKEDAERRSSLVDPDGFLTSFFNGGGTQTTAGVLVNEHTSMALSAVFQAIRVISEGEGCLPFPVYQRVGTNGRRRATEHPVFRLLDEQPNEEMTPSTFRKTLTAHALGWGNGVAEIERTRGGIPIALHPLRPDRYQIIRDPADRSIKYDIWNPGNSHVQLEKQDVLHIKGLGFDGLIGYPVTRLARQSIGLGIAAEAFGASLFGNGAKPNGILETDKVLKDSVRANLRESFEQVHRGSSNGNRIGILEDGVKFKATAIAPEEAQFLQTRTFQISEIARWFNIQPHKLFEMSRQTHANIEQESIDFVVYCLRPWLISWEEEVRIKLFTPEERSQYYAEHLVDGLLRGDIKSRYDAYGVGRQWGWFCADDIRGLENLPPLPNDTGKIFMVPANMQAAQVVARQAADPAATAAAVTAAPAVSPTGVVAPQPETDDIDQLDDIESLRSQIALAHRPAITDAIARIVRRETEVLRRAIKKEPQTFPAYLDRFYADAAGYVRSALTPAMSAYGGSLRAIHSAKRPKLDPLEFEVTHLPQKYIDESLAELRSTIAASSAAEIPAAVEAVLSKWESEKPARLAEKLTTGTP